MNIEGLKLMLHIAMLIICFISTIIQLWNKNWDEANWRFTALGGWCFAFVAMMEG